MSERKRTNALSCCAEADWFDNESYQHKSSVDNILAESDPGNRFERLEQAQEQSAEFFYQSLHARLSKHESITVEQTFPPSAASLMAHLRIRGTEELESKFDLKLFAERLLEQVGLEQTIERLAALPILLPDAVWQSVRLLSKDALGQLIVQLKERLLTPLSQIHLFHILADRGCEIADYLDQAKSILNDLVSEVGERRWKTFGRILECVRREFALRGDYRALPVQARLLVVWLHSCRLHNILLLGPVDEAAVETAFGNAAEFNRLDLNASTASLWFDAAHPRNVDRWTCVLKGIGAILRRLPTDIADALRFAEPPDQNWSGRFHYLLRVTEQLPNVLRSFLGGNNFVDLQQVFAPGALKKIMPRAPLEVIEEALKQLDANPMQPAFWQLLDLCLHDIPVPPDVAIRLEELIGRTDFFALLKDRSATEYMAIHFACSRTRAGLSGPVRDHVERHVFSLLEMLSAKKEPFAELRERAGVLVSGLLMLGMTSDNESELFRHYYELLTKALKTYPDLARLLKYQFGGWRARQPLAWQHGFWEFEMALRAVI